MFGTVQQSTARLSAHGFTSEDEAVAKGPLRNLVAGTVVGICLPACSFEIRKFCQLIVGIAFPTLTTTRRTDLQLYMNNCFNRNQVNATNHVH